MGGALILARVLGDPQSAMSLDAEGWAALLTIAHHERLSASLAFRLDGLAGRVVPRHQPP